MDLNVPTRTVIPIVLLIGIGFLSRKMNILKSGDERILSSYVYHFALPALFFVNMIQTHFNKETLRFIFAGIVPVVTATMICVVLHRILRFKKDTTYLLNISTIFGSHAFFGIPFITFAFPTNQGEHLATLSAATISIASVTISITLLELYGLEGSTILRGLKVVTKKLSKNPLILSILSGTLLSVLDVIIPSPIITSLHMLGKSSSTVAIFMLGVFLYGRKYTKFGKAFGLSLLRMFFYPLLAFLITILLDLSELERATLVLMHSMPVAISMIILSERYDFHKDVVASLILISSLGAGLYLNFWLFFLDAFLK